MKPGQLHLSVVEQIADTAGSGCDADSGLGPTKFADQDLVSGDLVEFEGAELAVEHCEQEVTELVENEGLVGAYELVLGRPAGVEGIEPLGEVFDHVLGVVLTGTAPGEGLGYVQQLAGVADIVQLCVGSSGPRPGNHV